MKEVAPDTDTLSESQLYRWQLFFMAVITLIIYVPAALSIVDQPAADFARFIDWHLVIARKILVRGGAILTQIGWSAAITGGILLLALLVGLLHGPIQSSRWTIAQLRREFIFGLFWLWVLTINSLAIGGIAASGYSKLYFDIGKHGYLYAAVSVVVLVIAFDAAFYFYHRLLHVVGPLYKYIHSVHHLTDKPNVVFTPFQLSPVEALFNTAFRVLVVVCIPAHPLTLYIFGTVITVRTYIGHCGFELFPHSVFETKWLSWNATVTHHDLHHSDNSCNYSFCFAWWDRWMGTEHPDYYARYLAVIKNRGPRLKATTAGSSTKS